MIVLLAAEDRDRQLGHARTAGRVGKIETQHRHCAGIGVRWWDIGLRALQGRGKSSLDEAEAVLLPGCNASRDRLLHEMALHWFFRQAELELHRLFFQRESRCVPGEKCFHVLIVPTNENTAIAVEPEFLARAIHPENKTNAGFFRRHALPRGGPGLLRQFRDPLVESLLS